MYNSEYNQEVLRILEKEIRTHGYLLDHGGWTLMQLKRGATTLEVEPIDVGYGKKLWVNDFHVGTIF